MHKIVPNDTREYVSACLRSVLSIPNRRVTTEVVYTDDVAKDTNCIQKLWTELFPNEKVCILINKKYEIILIR
jgi:hypothetical protein